MATFPFHGQSILAALQEQWCELAFSAIPLNADTFNQLDPLNPIFISCQLTDAPFYWDLLSQTMHAAGYTLLAESGECSDIDKLRTLFAAHAEPFTIVIRADGDIILLEQLKLAPIDMGLKSSGTRQTALTLFNILGAKEQDLNLKSMANLPDALCSKQIDAFALVMGHPNRIVLDTAKRCAVSFLLIEGDTRDQLLKGGQILSAQSGARPHLPWQPESDTHVCHRRHPGHQCRHAGRVCLSPDQGHADPADQVYEQTYGYANMFHQARNKTGPELSIEQDPGAAKYFEELKAAGKL